MPLKKGNIVYVFHASGMMSHYRALTEGNNCKGNLEVKFREFSILRLLARGIFRVEPAIIFKQFANAAFFLNLFFSKGKRVIVGMSPYDWRILLYRHLLNKHIYFFHTSSVYWDHTDYPRNFFIPTTYLRNKWGEFIENSRGVFCATEESASELQKIFKVNRLAIQSLHLTF